MENLDLNSIPAKALNYSTRLKLAEYLNPEQQLLSKDGFARDYRGLAEQMEFQYNEIRNFERSDSPTQKILDAWTVLPQTTIGQLVQFLENMGRHDIVQDLLPKFENDAKFHIQKCMRVQSQECPLQVPEITSCRTIDSRLDDSGILTRQDAYTGEYTLYDAFVCYADEDIDFVTELARFLESESVGFKLFIRQRDMLAGHSEYETSLQLIQERCKRVLIILSPDFLKCPAYEAQASFAAGLGIDEKCRKLIPIVYKPCEIPMMLKFISKIDFTKPGCVIEWIWDKVVSSLRDGHGPAASFISSERKYPSLCNSLPQISSGPSDRVYPAITYPPTTSSLIVNTGPSCSTSPPRMIVQEETLSASTMNTTRVTTKQKSKLENLRFWKLPRKNANECSTSSSNVTSGFHSQMSDEGSENGTGRWAQPFSGTWNQANHGT